MALFREACETHWRRAYGPRAKRRKTGGRTSPYPLVASEKHGDRLPRLLVARVKALVDQGRFRTRREAIIACLEAGLEAAQEALESGGAPRATVPEGDLVHGPETPDSGYENAASRNPGGE